MIDKTLLEHGALASVLRPMGEVVAEIGINKPLSAWTREEALALVEVVVDAWQKYLLDNNAPIPLTTHPKPALSPELDEGSKREEEPL